MRIHEHGYTWLLAVTVTELQGKLDRKIQLHFVDRLAIWQKHVAHHAPRKFPELDFSKRRRSSRLSSQSLGRCLSSTRFWMDMNAGGVGVQGVAKKSEKYH